MLEALGDFFKTPFGREGRQLAEAQSDFRIDGWEYGNRENVVQLCERVAKRTRCSAKDLLKAFDTGGGKALGLLFCELIAKRCQDVKVEVPRWKILTAQEVARLPREEEALLAEMNKLGFEYPILRSSDQEEDFLSAAAGTHASHVLRKRPGKVNLSPIPHIVQRACIGFGAVINLVKSPVFGGKTIVKVSSGRCDSIDRFTSATNDPEAAVMVLDPMNGNVLLEKQSFDADRVTALDDKSINFGALASNIRAAAAAMGIDFGVEFEFIFDPINHKIWLVQVRPLSEKIRSLNGNIQEKQKKMDLENAETSSQLLFRTSVINRPFDLKLGVQMIGLHNRINNAVSAQDLCHLPVPKLRDAESAHAGGSNLISFYPKIGGVEFFGVDAAPRTFLKDYSLGTKAVIVQGPIWPSTVHGRVEVGIGDSHNEVVRRQEIQAFLQPRLAMMSVTKEQAALLRGELDRNPQAVLHLVSDGIVGEVRLLAPKE